MSWSRIAHVAITLFIAFGCLLVGADATGVALAETAEISKVSLKFCVMRDCDTKGEFMKRKPDCFCCVVLPGVPCWHTVKECQANCRPCSPNC
uniref:Predicted protein n=1 Tax=Hordeum vulgare subsp. vulgare TaxID=112509 RepID=F2EIN8_HORVV|nr:predicted protein [Hordeum vulgare subsp. vulgare]